jgi:hypothetical protein
MTSGATRQTDNPAGCNERAIARPKMFAGLGDKAVALALAQHPMAGSPIEQDALAGPVRD